MNKKILIYICFGLTFCSSAFAGDREVWRQVYRLLQTQYIEEMNISDVFNPSIKALEKLDKNVRIAVEKKTVTIYYQGRLNRTFTKPLDEKDVAKWADFTVYLMNEFKKVSPQLDNHDFEMTEVMLYNGVTAFDKSMHYYPILDIGQKQEKIQRFSANVIEDNILYIKLGTINDYTLNHVKDAFQQYKNVQGVLLDLRGNKGGYLKQALELTDMFLPAGSMIYTIAKERGSRKVYQSSDKEIYKGVPIVILADGQTASAAEVLSLVLQEQGRALLVGSQTYGKGTVQNIYKLENEGHLALTTEKFFSMRDVSVEEKGIHPDICSADFDATEDINTVIEKGKKIPCPKVMKQSPFDFEVALRILQNQIKNKTSSDNKADSHS